MLTFTEWLLEYIKFNTTRNRDFTASDRIVFFSKNGKDSYRESGYTHGECSHAIKHLIEFREKQVFHAANVIRKMAADWERRGELDFIELVDSTGRTIAKGWTKVKEMAIPRDWICSLDYINDLDINKGNLTKHELDLKVIAEHLRKAYDEELQKRIDKAIDLDNMRAEEIARICRTNSIIKFTANQKQEYILDLKDDAIAVFYNGKASTFYKFRIPGQGAEVVMNLLRKKPHMDYKNEEVPKGFQMAINA